jgi:carbon-monoxide dehydrogenase large subunit
MHRVATPQIEVERLRKLQGLGRYTADGRFEGRTCVAFVRSLHAHARILSVDTGDAASMPGVLRILTGEDCLAVGLKNFPVIDRVGSA